MPDASLPPDPHDRARRVRLACFDVDGTLTDGRLTFDTAGHESKSFHVHDGQGLVLLRRAGIEVALITARTGSVAERRAQELGVQAFTGVGDKLACIRGACDRLGIGLDEVAMMGDDLPDLRAMLNVGLSACPADAHPWVATRAHWQSRHPGGRGAARELCDLVLDAQGRVEGLLAALLDEAPPAIGARS